MGLWLSSYSLSPLEELLVAEAVEVATLLEESAGIWDGAELLECLVDELLTGFELLEVFVDELECLLCEDELEGEVDAAELFGDVEESGAAALDLPEVDEVLPRELSLMTKDDEDDETEDEDLLSAMLVES